MSYCLLVVRYRVLITGQVQGVNFRAACRRMALKHGVRGWVRNLPDGSVEAAFEGPADDVRYLLDWTRRGPQLAVVAEIAVQAEQPEGLGTFLIRYQPHRDALGPAMPRTGNARSGRRPGTAPPTPAQSRYYTAPMSTWARRPSDLRWHRGNAHVITHPELDIWLAQRRDDGAMLPAGIRPGCATGSRRTARRTRRPGTPCGAPGAGAA